MKLYAYIDGDSLEEVVRLEAESMEQAEHRYALLAENPHAFEQPTGMAMLIECDEESPCRVPLYKNGYFIAKTPSNHDGSFSAVISSERYPRKH